MKIIEETASQIYKSDSQAVDHSNPLFSQIKPISEDEFNLLRQLIHSRFGIFLTEEKRLLVVGRLQKVVHSHGFQTFKEYYNYLLADSAGKALEELAIRISTNHTFFYRESDHFQLLQQKVLPQLAAQRRENGNLDLRIWCAGCSSGEEPYTLVMILLEFLGNEYNKWSAGVLATDLSSKMLTDAQQGVYPPERISPLPQELKERYFSRLPNGDFAIAERIKKEVTFRRLNLICDQFPFRKPFDIIFCRNVMIYFDQETRKSLVHRFYQNLSPGGYLFTGHSESLRNGETPLRYLQPAVYQKEELK